MTLARDIMTPAPQCVGEDDTLVEAARLMAELDVGALPICGKDRMLHGMVTDRDIVVKCLARGGDPRNATAGSLAEGKPITVHADDDIRQVLDTMSEHQIRRVPVVEDHDLVGIIGQADVALALAPEPTGETVAEISK